ncbi:membrane protein [Mycobacterium sp. SWH-M3]|nr:membrane protein [Mycobacterium sp. SWH-M3]
MTTQTFFALFWGWLTVIVTAMFFIRPQALHDVKRLIVENRAFGLTYGYLSLFLGLISVLLHNVWTMDWHVLITIFGWMALLKGIIVIAWPEISKNTKYETRIKSTRIALVVVSALAVWMLGATYA